jgi:hypothetical protein
MKLTHPAYAKPELLASGPRELWSWDIRHETRHQRAQDTTREGQLVTSRRGPACAPESSSIASHAALQPTIAPARQCVPVRNILVPTS